MDTLENKTPAQSELSGLREEVDSLRQMLGSVLILVLIVSGTFNIYLLRQWKGSRTDLAGYKPGAVNMIVGYEKNEKAAVDNFVRKMIEYGQTHPDFLQILNKYPLPKGPPPPSATASPAPAIPGAGAPSTQVNPGASTPKK